MNGLVGLGGACGVGFLVFLGGFGMGFVVVLAVLDLGSCVLGVVLLIACGFRFSVGLI